VDVCLFTAYFSTLLLSDFLVDGFTMSISLFFIGGANTAQLRNADIRRISTVSIVFSSNLPYKVLHFAIYNSDITIQNVTVLDTTLQLGPCFAFIFSNYSISSVSLARVSIGSVLISSESFGLASDLYMDRIVANMHAFVTSNSALTLSKVTLANSQILAKSAFLMGTTEANITNFTVINCSMEAFLICKESEIVAVNVTIQGFRAEWSICYAVTSALSLEGWKLQESVIQRISVTSSNLTILHSTYFHIISSWKL